MYDILYVWMFAVVIRSYSDKQVFTSKVIVDLFIWIYGYVQNVQHTYIYLTIRQYSTVDLRRS
jgi:hypothetical protein